MAHEFTHTFQIAAGYSPQWMLEGGAVLNECLLEALPSAATRGVTRGRSFRHCVKSYFLI